MARDRFTRKELKQDRIREELAHGVEYVASHRTRILVWLGGLIGVTVAAVTGYTYYTSAESQARSMLFEGVNKYNGEVSLDERVGRVTFPTEETKFRETEEHFQKLAGEFASRDEAVAAEYYLALVDIERGNTEEARQRLQKLVDEHKGGYASLARIVLADLLVSQGKMEEAGKHYQYLIDNPSPLVPKERAQLGYVDTIMESDPDRAREILLELRKQPGVAAVLAAGRLDRLSGSSPSGS